MTTLITGTAEVRAGNLVGKRHAPFICNLTGVDAMVQRGRKQPAEPTGTRHLAVSVWLHERLSRHRRSRLFPELLSGRLRLGAPGRLGLGDLAGRVGR